MKASLYHLHVNVSDARKSLPFYTDFFSWLGYRVIDKSHEHVAFSDGKTSFWIIQADKGRREKPYHRKNVGLNHLAFRVGAKKSVDSFAKDFLRKRKIKPLYKSPKYFPEYRKGYYAVYFEDLDRIKLEVVFIPK